MKSLIVTALLASFSLSAQAASLKLTPDEAFKVVEVLLLANVKANKTKPVYTLRLADASCRALYFTDVSGPDSELWGLPEYECTNPKVKGAAAKTIFDTLEAIQTTYGEKISITDCGMGKCYAKLKKVDCRIKSVEFENAKRFSCVLTDDQ